MKIKDENHKHFGKTGQLTDYDTFDKEYVMHFDKLTNDGNVYWIAESTRVSLAQVMTISKYDLEKMQVHSS